MHHEGNRGNDNEHHRRNRVEQEAQTDFERFVEREPALVEDYILEALAGGVDEFGRAAEIIDECRVVGEHQYGAHAKASERSGKFMRHLHSQQTQKKEHKQGNGKYQ